MAKLIGVLEGYDDEWERYRMEPVALVKRGGGNGKRTVLLNLDCVARAVGREAKWLAKFIATYLSGCEEETFETFETSGFLDFLGFREPETGTAKYTYQSFFGHNFCSVNPWLWTQHICPLIRSLRPHSSVSSVKD